MHSGRSSEHTKDLLVVLGFNPAVVVEADGRPMMEAIAPVHQPFFILRVTANNKKFSLVQWKSGHARHIDSANIITVDQVTGQTRISVTGGIVAGWDIYGLPITEAEVIRLIHKSNVRNADFMDAKNPDEHHNPEAA
jgi:hypothetical protein